MWSEQKFLLFNIISGKREKKHVSVISVTIQNVGVDLNHLKCWLKSRATPADISLLILKFPSERKSKVVKVPQFVDDYKNYKIVSQQLPAKKKQLVN